MNQMPAAARTTMSAPVRQRPLISIAIPTFNRAALLRGCLAVALDQTYGDFEVVVSDNASSDETPKVLAEFNDRRLRAIRQNKNIGALPNWNACLAEARGEFLIVVSDDDRITSHFVERCAELIGVDSKINLIVAIGDTYVPETNMTLREIASRKLGTGIVEGIEVLDELLRGRITPQMCTIAVRTELLRSRGGFPDDWPHTADLAAWVPVLFTGNVGFINERCGTYCSHAGTQTARMDASVRVADIRKLTNAIVAEINRSQVEPSARTELEEQAKRYLARNAVGLIALSRSNGASLSETLPIVWRMRRELVPVVPVDLMRLWRQILTIMLPRRLTRAIQHVLEVGRRVRGVTPRNAHLWDHRSD